ncbi:hypothetical protein DFH07DRAFT_779543, partial [Mycena maculata]
GTQVVGFARQTTSQQHDIANELHIHLKGVEDTLARYWGLKDTCLCLKKAALLISEKLEKAKTTLENLYVGLLPDNPGILEWIEDLPLPSRRHGRSKRADCNFSDWLDPDYDHIDETPGLDPTDDELSLILPRLAKGPIPRLVRIVAFYSIKKPLYHAIFCAPNPNSFQYGDYVPPARFSGATFRYYCVFDKRYLSAAPAIDLVERGRFLILVKTDLVFDACARLGYWEERARDSAATETGMGATLPILVAPLIQLSASLLSPSSSPLLPSSAPASSPPDGRLNPVASSSKNISGADSSSKRLASPAESSLPSRS